MCSYSETRFPESIENLSKNVVVVISSSRQDTNQKARKEKEKITQVHQHEVFKL